MIYSRFKENSMKFILACLLNNLELNVIIGDKLDGSHTVFKEKKASM